jgi:hypothetical protein
MDVNSVKTFLEAAGLVLSLLKKTKDALPDGPQKDTVGETLEQAETQLKIAEAQAAVTFGYELCRAHWPPEIMLSTGIEGQYRCPKCGRQKPPSLAELVDRVQKPW